MLCHLFFRGPLPQNHYPSKTLCHLPPRNGAEKMSRGAIYSPSHSFRIIPYTLKTVYYYYNYNDYNYYYDY